MKQDDDSEHVGEATEFGFELHARLLPELSSDEIEAVMERMLQLVESRYLEFGGSVGLQIDGYITRAEGGSATDEDRAALASFFRADPAVLDSEVAELSEA